MLYYTGDAYKFITIYYSYVWYVDDAVSTYNIAHLTLTVALEIKIKIFNTKWLP